MTLLSVAGLAKRYHDAFAVADASLEVAAGEIVALLGPNGAGKTTLLDCLAGLRTRDAGTVRIAGALATPDALRQTLFYLPDGVSPWSAQPASWTLAFTMALFGSVAQREERLDVLNTLQIGALGTQRVGTLSKGQRKRLLLAIALLAPQPLLLLDEPFDGLDLRFTRATIALLRRSAARGRALVLSIHSMSDAERVADRLVLLHDGRTVASGTSGELRARVALPDAPLEDVFLALT